LRIINRTTIYYQQLGGNSLEIKKNIEFVAHNLEIRGGLNSPSFKVSELIMGGRKA